VPTKGRPLVEGEPEPAFSKETRIHGRPKKNAPHARFRRTWRKRAKGPEGKLLTLRWGEWVEPASLSNTGKEKREGKNSEQEPREKRKNNTQRNRKKNHRQAGRSEPTGGEGGVSRSKSPFCEASSQV